MLNSLLICCISDSTVDELRYIPPKLALQAAQLDFFVLFRAFETEEESKKCVGLSQKPFVHFPRVSHDLFQYLQLSVINVFQHFWKKN